MTSQNTMQELRRWARENAEADCPLMLSPERRNEIGQAILDTLNIADMIWEEAAGRKLTEEEKFGIGG